MGKELLRKALDNLLDALFKRQVDRGGEFEYLITDDDGERRKLNSAMEEIDDWDEDEDLKELGGELDEETIMQRVKEKFITKRAFEPFTAALEQNMWARDHEQLLSRKQKKARREAERGGRDWELRIQPPIPASALRFLIDASRDLAGACDDGVDAAGVSVGRAQLASASELVEQLWVSSPFGANPPPPSGGGRSRLSLD